MKYFILVSLTPNAYGVIPRQRQIFGRPASSFRLMLLVTVNVTRLERKTLDCAYYLMTDTYE